ncbi:hypothetical protein CERZMDRAFT_102666 [Cercospora zeae-maydis SCOH1-5]|uniref:Transcription factor domain-containing protein n=1 Tax=Cercospora zeae-maydis SCOH1-5 TaxID=717836 RepID=A0A6A6F3R0_9PEZI|nr:hypothetical protein CERZMDRAFT_102666 [Cercospora zeae-maydis SCOH1-5]
MLRRREVQALLHRAYADGQPGQLDSQDSYVFFLICAISAVRLRRQGLPIQHPSSFFLSALQYAEHINLLSGIVALQNLLLLNRFAVYCHTGVSTWDMPVSACVCASLWNCISGHLSTSVPPRSNIAEYSDEDIEIDLPAVLSHPELAQVASLAQTRMDALAESPVAVFIAFIKLRQISSRIHTTFFAKTKRASAQISLHTKMAMFGELLDIYQKLHEDIKLWRQQSPVYFQAETFYQMKECLGHEMPDALPYAKVFRLICSSAFPNWTTHEPEWQALHGSFTDIPMQGRLPTNTFQSPPGPNAVMYGGSDQASLYHIDDPGPGMPHDWSYSPGHLFADMEAYVGQFATGDFTWDPLLNPLS